MLAWDEKYEETKKIPLHNRVLYLEHKFRGNEHAGIELLDTVPPPRANKTHLPYRYIRRWLEEDRVKAIVTTRNPKDSLVSYFKLIKQLKSKYILHYFTKLNMYLFEMYVINLHNTVWGQIDSGGSFPCAAQKPSASQF